MDQSQRSTKGWRGAKCKRNVWLYHVREHWGAGHWMWTIWCECPFGETETAYGRERTASKLPNTSCQSSTKHWLYCKSIVDLDAQCECLTSLFLFAKQPNPSAKNLAELASPMDGSEITSFNIAKNFTNLSMKSPNENHFANSPKNQSPANVYRSDDCNEILAKELEQLNEVERSDRSPDSERGNLVSQSSIEIEICDHDNKDELNSIQEEPECIGEVGLFTFIWQQSPWFIQFNLCFNLSHFHFSCRNGPF